MAQRNLAHRKRTTRDSDAEIASPVLPDVRAAADGQSDDTALVRKRRRPPAKKARLESPQAFYKKLAGRADIREILTELAK